MKAYLTRRYWFSASHRLQSDDMTAEENQAVYGKCNNPGGHGHNYTFEVTVGGPVDATTGMICNLADLDEFVKREILDRFDHENLNTVREFHGIVPTTENLCVALYNVLDQGFRPARIEKVRVEETMFNAFEYAGNREMRN